MYDNNQILSDGEHSLVIISIFLVNFQKTPEICPKGFQKVPRTFQSAFWGQEFFVMFPRTGGDDTNCLPNAKMTATKIVLIQSVKPEYVPTSLNHAPLPPHKNWLAFLKSGINNRLFFGILRLPCQSSDWTLLSFASLCTVCNIAVVEMPTHVPC